MGANFQAEPPRPTKEDLDASWRAVSKLDEASGQSLSKVLSHYQTMLDAAWRPENAQHQLR